MILTNIKKLCEGRGMTLAALERSTGIGNGVIAGWAEGRPRVDLLMRVADFFGVTLDELVKGGEESG